MFSLWEQQSFLSTDIVIIGAGITGLSAAASIKESKPNLGVIVLENGILPTGASTKNAGFACFGSISELLGDISSMGIDEMASLVEKRWRGLQKTQQRLGKPAMDLLVNSGFELIFEDPSDAVQSIQYINKSLHSIFKQEVFVLSDAKINHFGFGETHHLIENKLEGQIDTGKLMAALWNYCGQLGIRIHTGCKVQSISEENDHVSIACSQAVFKAKKAGICTNAFANDLLDRPIDLEPGRGMVMVMETASPLRFEGAFHYEEGYYYFRDYYGKILFGGGRNLDKKEEATTTFTINQTIKQKLIQDIETIILPGQGYTVTSEWTGIMAFGKNKKPIVAQASDKIAMGVRLGGMGVAIGSLVGEEVAQLLLH